MKHESYKGQAKFRSRQRARLLAIPLPVRALVGRQPFAKMPTVEKIAIQLNGCWIWTGAVNGAGYGRVGNEYVHRAVYRLLVGPIPTGMTLDHLRDRCSSTSCCNPDHLEPVTQYENMARVPKPDVCAQGHDMTDPSNVYCRPDAGPLARGMCRRCRNIRRSNFRARRGY